LYSFFVIKPTNCTNFENLFCHETLHVSDNSSVHHQEFIHFTLNNGICHTGLQTAFEQDQDGTAVPSCAVPSWSCSKAVYKTLWHISLLSVQWINSWWWTDVFSETCRISWQNKFVKLVHLVGFITKKFVMVHGTMNVKKVLSSVTYSPSHRQTGAPMLTIQSTLRTAPDLCKYVSLDYCLTATVFDIQGYSKW